MILSFLPVLCLFASVFGAEDKLDIYDQAKVCPHRFHMGCMLDVVEKSCTGLQAVETCATKGKCNNVDELQRIIGALDPKNFEALNKCCCTKAFAEGYEDCKNPDPVCKKAIADHVEKDVKSHLAALKKCMKKPKKSTCKDALESAKWVSGAVQKARGELWSAEGCKMLAPPEPVSACGWNVKPTPRAVERADLYCDTIIWQFKEMGASDPFMSQCKDAPKMPKNVGRDQDPEVEEEEVVEEESDLGGDGDTDNEMGNKIEEKGDDLYSKAAKCPHRKHMGCLLDVIEKSCEATREMMMCANGTECNKDETNLFLKTLDEKSPTFLLTCCCPGLAYQKCKNPDESCLSHLDKKTPSNIKDLKKALKAYKKKANKENAEKAIKAIKEIRDNLQKARGEMWKVKGCEILAPMLPLIECGWTSGSPMPIERKDLFCDALMWQYKELNMYDDAMNDCPNAPKVKPEDVPKEEPEEEVEEEISVRDEL